MSRMGPAMMAATSGGSLVHCSRMGVPARAGLLSTARLALHHLLTLALASLARRERGGDYDLGRFFCAGWRDSPPTSGSEGDPPTVDLDAPDSGDDGDDG